MQVEFYKQSPAELAEWVARHFRALEKTVTPDLCQYLVFITGGSMTTLHSEIGKIAAYCRGTAITRQDIDSVVLSPAPEKLGRYDLPLYRRDNGQFVLHRVVEAGETYTCMGDNQFVKEPGVRRDQIIALVTAFTRGEKLHRVTEPGYWLYCRVWYHSRHLRRFWRRGMGWLRRHWK